MMKFSLLLFLIAYNIVGHTQKLSLKNTDIILQTTFGQAISRNVGQNELINGRYYRIFSFLKLPTNVEKNEMNSLGIRFKLFTNKQLLGFNSRSVFTPSVRKL